MIIEWARLTDQELTQVDRELPVILPTGLVEAHGPALTLGLDNDTAEHFARMVCEATGAILLPNIPYGYAAEMAEYSGTVGVRLETFAALLADICISLCSHGFRKIIVLCGHGANTKAADLAFERVWERYPDLKPACWAWWTVAGVDLHHADKGETEFALLTGSPVYMDRARDYQFSKPWHLVRSRAAYQPESGGINGYPTQARGEDSRADYEKVLSTLIQKVNQAKEDRAPVPLPPPPWPLLP